MNRLRIVVSVVRHAFIYMLTIFHPHLPPSPSDDLAPMFVRSFVAFVAHDHAIQDHLS